MKILEQLIKDLNISETEALQILFKYKTKKLVGRPKVFIKYYIYNKVREMIKKNSHLSPKSACANIAKSDDFAQVQRFYGSNIKTLKRIYNCYLEMNTAENRKYAQGIGSLLIQPKVTRK